MPPRAGRPGDGQAWANFKSYIKTALNWFCGDDKGSKAVGNNLVRCAILSIRKEAREDAGLDLHKHAVVPGMAEMHATSMAAMHAGFATLKTHAGNVQLLRVARDMTETLFDLAFATRNIDMRTALLRGDFQIVRNSAVPFGAMWQFRRRGEKTALLGNEDIFYLVPQLGDVAMCPTFWMSLWLVLTHAEAEAYAEEHGVDVGHLRMFPRMDRYSGELQFDKDAEQWSTNTTFVRAWTSCGFEGKVTRHSMHARVGAAPQLRDDGPLRGGHDADAPRRRSSRTSRPTSRLRSTRTASTRRSRWPGSWPSSPSRAASATRTRRSRPRPRRSRR